MDKLKKEENIEKQNSEKSVKRYLKNKRVVKYIYFIFIFIYSLIVNLTINGVNIELGDFGSLIPVLLYSFVYMSFKWLPILCIVGLLFTIFETKFKDMCKSFIWIVGIICGVSTFLNFLV
jgi:uncharacterized membrane protein